MDTNLKIVVLPTNDVKSMCVTDASVYEDTPEDPFLLVTPPGFPAVSLPFNVGGNNILTSDVLGISETGVQYPLPDGIYTIGYSIYPSYEMFTNISILRVDRLQEKFDTLFMTLDMMVCDDAIKTQTKVNLYTIQLLIAGAIAAANECAVVESNKLYDKASTMIDNLLSKDCGCSGNNYLTNFK